MSLPPMTQGEGAGGASVDALFAGKDPVVRAVYERVVAALRELGPFEEQPKKTSIHLANGTGFAGVHPRKAAVLLNLRLDRALHGPRIAKSEQVSRNRFHNEVRLAAPDDVDEELTGWLRQAYALASG